MPAAEAQLLHGSAVMLSGRGVLLLGKSGAGKSDLALRLIDRGGVLIGDDQLEISRDGGFVFAAAPERLRGRLEVRGLGIIPVPHTAGRQRLHLAITLVERRGDIERLPTPQPQTVGGIDLPALSAFAFHASTPIMIEMALEGLDQGWDDSAVSHPRFGPGQDNE